VSTTPTARGYGRALVFQHLPDEHPGTLKPLLEDAGLSLTTVELDAGQPIPDLEPFDLMVATGGPQHVWQQEQHLWLVVEKAAIEYWVTELDRPFLGVCLWPPASGRRPRRRCARDEDHRDRRARHRN
jgi:hypothetical protein